jgi:hypothetical protein
MALFIDARIPVVFGVPAGSGDAVLEPDPSWDKVHPIACACCDARGPAAMGLDRLFLARVTNTIPWFSRVVVPAAGEAAVRAVLDTDPVVTARFRAG